ncbi:hypothetical protein [Streptomyces sp. NPDC126522]|uniref:hypothetical protein n=1 Tax=Streptomyces sp. NPDC126522 TaxID=3155211 RepID=UPI00332758C4
MRVTPLARGHGSSSTGPAVQPALRSAPSGLTQHLDDLWPVLTLFGHVVRVQNTTRDRDQHYDE